MADWSELPTELLHLISQHFHTSIDLLHFRSVCHTWRAAAPRPAPAADLIPILPGCFYLSKRTVYLLQPPIPNHSSWVIKLACGYTTRMHLLHPLSGLQIVEHFPKESPRLIDFSNIRVTELGEEYTLRYINSQPRANSIEHTWRLYKEKVAVLNNGRGGFVVVAIHHSRNLMVYKSGEEKWRLINDLALEYEDIILWGGRFYAVDKLGKIVVVNMEDLKVSVVADVIIGGKRKFFVGSDRELLLVNTYWDAESSSDGIVTYNWLLKINVYRRASSMEKWTKITDLGDTIMFLSYNYAVLVSATQVGGGNKCLGNCIFYDYLENRNWTYDYVGVFNLESGCLLELNNRIDPAIFWPPPKWASLQ